MDITQAENIRNLRADVLKLTYENHRQQQSRLRLVTLEAVLVEKLLYDLGRADVITVLQDLRDRGYVKFVQEKNKWSGRVDITGIEITPAGRDLVERTTSDAAVNLD